MATHLRKQIRDAFIAQISSLASIGGNVSSGTFYPTELGQSPSANVYIESEDIVIASMGRGHLRERTASVVIELMAKDTANVDDAIDAAVKDIENSFDGNPTLGGLVKYVEPKHYAREDDGGAELPAVRFKMNFEVVYYAAQSAPDVAQ